MEGDHNTIYFHIMASHRRRSNVITPSMVGLSNDCLVSVLKRAASNVFKSRFTAINPVHVVG